MRCNSIEHQHNFELKKTIEQSLCKFWFFFSCIFLIHHQQVLVQFYSKQNGKFNQMFKRPRFEWCELMSGTKSANMLLKSLIEAVKDQCPQIFHKCPYEGIHDLTNITMPKKIIGIFPNGIFRTNVTITDDVSKTFISFSILLELYT